MTFWRFPKIFRRFFLSIPKARQSFPNIFEKFTKIAADSRGGADDLLIIHLRAFVTMTTAIVIISLLKTTCYFLTDVSMLVSLNDLKDNKKKQ